MRHRNEHIQNAKELRQQFAEVEKRIAAMVAENRELKGRVGELERDLAQARREAQDLEHLHGKRLHIREKIERILQTLETAGEGKQDGTGA